MLKTVIPRLVNLPCLYPTSLSLSSLQSRIRTSDGVAMSVTRRQISENAAGAKTPSFQYFWQPGSGYYGESLGRVSKVSTDLCDDFVLSHIDGVDDRKLFVQLLAKGFGVALDMALRNAFRNTRSAEKKSEILKQYYEFFVQKVAVTNPKTFQSELFVSRLVAQKLK